MKFGKLDLVKRANLGDNGFAVCQIKTHFAARPSCGPFGVGQGDVNLFKPGKEVIPFGLFFRCQSDNHYTVTLTAIRNVYCNPEPSYC